MPAISSPSTWRSSPHLIKGAYAYILTELVYWQCSVNQTTFDYPLARVAYDGGTSLAGLSIFPGMVIRVESSGGVFKGYTQLLSLDVTNGFVYMRPRVGEVDIQFSDNDNLKFLHWYQPRARIPWIPDSSDLVVFGQFYYKDQYSAWDDREAKYIANGSETTYYVPGGNRPGTYGNGSDAIYPIADAGLACGLQIAPGDTTATTTFDGSNSDTTHSTSYAWTVTTTNGTVTSTSGTTTDTLTIEAEEGVYWVTLAVTDSTASRTAFSHRLLVVTGPSLEALQISDLSLEGDVDNGWSCRFNTLDDSLSDYPRNAPVLVWCDESFGATAGSLNGDTDREHMLFVGYASTDTTSLDAFVSDWQVSAVDVLTFAQNLPGFPETLRAQPSSVGINPLDPQVGFFLIGALNAWSYLYYVLLLNSNLYDVASIEMPSYATSIDLVSIDVPDGSLYDQLRLIADAIAAKATCDHQGRIYFRRNPHLMTNAQRSSLTTIVDLEAQDWERVTLNATQTPEKSWLIAWALQSDDDEYIPLKAGAPGEFPSGYGRDKQTLNQQIVAGQADLNSRAGRLYAYANRNVRDIEIDIVNGGLICDPAWQEWVTLTLAASTNTRGRSFSSDDMVVRSVSYRFDNAVGTDTQSWRLEVPVDSQTPSAATISLLPEGQINLQPLPPFTPPEPVDPPSSEIESDWARQWDFTLANYTTDFPATSTTIGQGLASSGSLNQVFFTSLTAGTSFDLVYIEVVLSGDIALDGNQIRQVYQTTPSMYYTLFGVKNADDATLWQWEPNSDPTTFRLEFRIDGPNGGATYYVEVVRVWGNGTDPFSQGVLL